MILFGINAGYGNSDCAKLPLSKVDLDGGWASFARTKNAIRRRAKLWPETVEAVREALKVRKEPTDLSTPAALISRSIASRSCLCLGFEFEKLAVKIGMTREGADFYDLRRTCASIGIQCNDDDAVRTVMGHKRGSSDMLGVYNRLQVSDERLRAVSDHIHDWLFPVKVKAKGKAKTRLRRLPLRHRNPATASRPPLRSRLSHSPPLDEGFKIGRVDAILGTAIFLLGDVVAT